MAKPLVVIFARAPRYGAVKTRLAREIGTAEALRFYRNSLRNLTRRLLRDRRYEVIVTVTPDAGAPAMTSSFGLKAIGQGPGDLGRRMIRALRRAGPRSAVVVGSDIPSLRAQHIAEAFRALGRAAFVLGPARDGGYWLIGVRHPLRVRRSILDGVRWSSHQTLDDTVARLRDVAVLSIVLDDVDDAAGYRRSRCA